MKSKFFNCFVAVVALLTFAGSAFAQRYEERVSRAGDILQLQQLVFSNAGAKQAVSDTLIGILDVDTTLALDAFGADKVGLFLNVRWMDTNDADTLIVGVAFSADNTNYTAFTNVDSIIGANDLSNTYHAVVLWPVGTVITNSDTVVAAALQGSMVTSSTVLTPAIIMQKAGYDPTLFPWMKVSVSTAREAGTDSVNVRGQLTKVYLKKSGY